MEICRWSRQPLANKFMDWVWDIVEKYRSNEIINMSRMTIILNKFVDVIEKQERQLSMQQKQLNKLTTYKKPYNLWFAKMNPRYKLLEEYFDITRGQLYKEILMELENVYDIDTMQIQANYCYENNVSTCYSLEPYEFVPKYREMIEQIVNSNLIKYGIAAKNDPITSTKHAIIFDIPAK